MRVLFFSGIFLTAALMLCAPASAGLGFSAPRAIIDDAPTDEVLDGAPRLETSGNGTWIASWQTGDLAVETDVVYTRSTDNGATWSNPKALNDNPGTDDVPDYSLRLVTDGAGNWVGIWVAERGYSGNVVDADLLIVTSSDDGVTWTDPEILRTDADIYSPQATVFAAGTTAPTLSTDRAGNWLATWRASSPVTSSGDIDLFAIHSTDNGATWSDRVSISPPNDDRRDLAARVGSIAPGEWLVVWNTAEFLMADGMFASRSKDNGATWSAPKTIIEYHVSNPVRHNLNRIETDGNGTWIGVGDYTSHDLDAPLPLPVSDYDLFSIRSENDGKTWTSPTPIDPKADTDNNDDLVPTLETDLNGNWLLVWVSGPRTVNNNDGDIFMRYSNDNCATWTPRVLLNSNGLTDPGNDVFATVKTNGAGDWLAIWQSYNELESNTDGRDTDVHVARSSFTASDGIFMLAPNGGEKFKTGKKIEINWLSIGDTGANVTLNLLRNGQSIATIVDATPNDGLFRWRIPAEIEPSKGYKIQAISMENSTLNDQSDDRFRIVAPK